MSDRDTDPDDAPADETIVETDDGAGELEPEENEPEENEPEDAEQEYTSDEDETIVETDDGEADLDADVDSDESDEADDEPDDAEQEYTSDEDEDEDEDDDDTDDDEDPDAEGGDALVSRLRLIGSQPLADRAAALSQLHDELRSRLEAGDAARPSA